MASLIVENITKNFGGLLALDNINVQVIKGQIVGLIGPNGSGKTTLFNLVTGFLTPSQGKIEFENKDLKGLRPDEIAQKGIIRTFQANVLFHSKTVLENLMVASYLQLKTGIGQQFMNTKSAQRDIEKTRKTALEIMEILGLVSFADKSARDLPHGYQRALGIGLALAANPKLLLLDEPATGMNVEEIRELMGIIMRLRERGTTIMIVEHNMKVVMNICDKIVVLDHGKKIAEGNPQTIANDKSVIEVYLGRKHAIT